MLAVLVTIAFISLLLLVAILVRLQLNAAERAVAGHDLSSTMASTVAAAVAAETARIETAIHAEASAGRTEASGQATLQRDELTRALATQRADLAAQRTELAQTLDSIRQAVAAEMQAVRQESAAAHAASRNELTTVLHGLDKRLTDSLDAVRTRLDARLAEIQQQNAESLEKMRQTVDEKLQGTLEERLGASFKQVTDLLSQVYGGLGDMQQLARGVGDLKNVLTNVKTRGTWGEMQLGAILEEFLLPTQYDRNVATANTSERVEFAIRLPGRNDGDQNVWLPIDSKFPQAAYERLLDASERADAEGVAAAGRELEDAIRKSAAEIQRKYLHPPRTTDFGMMFLPSESLYAEVMRRPGLASEVQRQRRVMITGPSTLAAVLNSLQVGFRTLAIEKRTSEVWQLLNAVRTQFGKFHEVLEKVQKKLREASNTVEDAQKATQRMGDRLKSVEAAGDTADGLLPARDEEMAAAHLPPSPEKGETDNDQSATTAAGQA